MQVLSPSSKEIAGFRRPVLTVGSFDGVHLAHQAIIEEVVKRAGKVDGKSVLVTFEPHPQVFLDPKTAPFLLMTEKEKLTFLNHLGLDAVIILPFTQELASMRANEFVEKILHNRLGVWEIVIGHDHAFGRGRRGRLRTLVELGSRLNFKVDAIKPIMYSSKPISSTRIRQELLIGHVREASDMLGHPYSFTGRIVTGDGRGRNLNYPTANMEIPPRKLVPANGVYAVTSDFASPVLHGLLNVGIRPTFGGKDRMVEVHFFDYQGSLYGHEISVRIVEKIRDEQKFEDGARLSEQIRIDEQVARRLLAQDEKLDFHIMEV